MESETRTASSRLRGRVPWLAGNLLILLGVALLGTSLVVATEAPAGDLRDPPQTANASIARVTASAASSTPPAVRSEHVHPTATQTEVVTQEPTLTPSTEPELSRQPLPHSGEGLFESLPDPPPAGSPYQTTTAGQRATHISVPAVGIDTDIVEVAPVAVQVGQQTVFEWTVADWAAGHHVTSANPGEGGNIVISGHDDARGEVFRGLHDIKIGDEITLMTASTSYRYVVHEVHLRRIAGASIDEQLSVGGFIAPMPEERVTLVTCWPYRVDTHRMIVIAKPAG